MPSHPSSQFSDGLCSIASSLLGCQSDDCVGCFMGRAVYQSFGIEYHFWRMLVDERSHGELQYAKGLSTIHRLSNSLKLFGNQNDSYSHGIRIHCSHIVLLHKFSLSGSGEVQLSTLHTITCQLLETYLFLP